MSTARNRQEEAGTVDSSSLLDPSPAHDVNERVWNDWATGYQNFAWFGGTTRSTYSYDVTRRRLHDALSLQGDETVLEIGCGPGTWTREIAKEVRDVTAVDLSEEMLSQAQHFVHPYHVDFVHSDAMSFQSSRRYDRIVSVRSIEYVADKQALCQKLAQLLSDDGSLVIVTKNPISAWGLRRVYWWSSFHVARWKRHMFISGADRSLELSDQQHFMERIPPWGLARILKRAGFQHVEVRPVVVGLPVFRGTPGELPLVPRRFAPKLLLASNRLSDVLATLPPRWVMAMMWLCESYCLSATKKPVMDSTQRDVKAT